MTSRSLRNRPTTAWRTIRRATATSLALLLGAGWASAQAPKWESNAPSKTQWAPFPGSTPSGTLVPVQAIAPIPTPTEPAPVPTLVPEPAAPIGSRVLLFQKPAEPKPAEQPMPGEPKPGANAGEPKPSEQKLTVGEPKRERVFRMTGDDDLNGKPSEVLKKLSWFETPPPVPPYATRTGTMPPMRLLLEPGYVVHRRLYFEEKNSERYGWDLGLAQPVVSLAYFYKDVLFWPSKLGSNRRERYDTNAGKYLPGSPVPYYLYPPEITAVGYGLGAAAIVGTVLLLP